MLGRRLPVGLCLMLMVALMGVAPLAVQTTPGVLSMHTTISSLGVVAPYTGDDDQDSTASIWYRPAGTSAWQAGSEMFADRPAREWRGSLVHLDPGTRYEIQVRFVDPDGVSPSVVSGWATTRLDYPKVGSGGAIRYVPDDGDLQAVIDASSPGDTVRLRGGVYHTKAVIGVEDSGRAGQYLTIEAAPGAHVVLDGSDGEINDGQVDNWHLYQDDMYYTDLSWGDTVCNAQYTMPGYVGEQKSGDGTRYLIYNRGQYQWADFLAAPPGKAFYDCDGSHPGRLYVVTYDRVDPDDLEMHVSRLETGLKLAGADYVRIRGLEIRYYGWYGMQLGSPGADQNIIEQNVFHGATQHILLGAWKTAGSDERTSFDNLIQDNHFYERGYRESGWSWETAYGHANVVELRMAYAGSGNVIRRNVFQGGSDAIGLGWQSHDTDIYENVIEYSMDDGIEVDDQPGYNIRVWGNSIRHCYAGISNQDWFLGHYWNAGPVYVFRNVIIGGRDPKDRTDSTGQVYCTNYAFKVGSDEAWPARIYYYHNTISIPDSPVNGNGIQDSGGTYFSGLVARNNLWNVRSRVFYLRYSTTVAGHDLDCDNVRNRRILTDSPFIQWSRSGGPDGDGVYRNLADFQAYTGQELHGISDNGTLFNPDGSLQAGSPEIDAGCVIVGFNDRGPWAYTGASPDMGAFEYAAVPDFANSNKVASVVAMANDDLVTFTIRIVNTGLPLTSTVTMTDILPTGLEYVAGTLTATSGMAWTEHGSSTSIYWEGVLDRAVPVEVAYGARLITVEPVALSNVALIDDGQGSVIERTATIIANGHAVYLPMIRKGQ